MKEVIETIGDELWEVLHCWDNYQHDQQKFEELLDLHHMIQEWLDENA